MNSLPTEPRLCANVSVLVPGPNRALAGTQDTEPIFEITQEPGVEPSLPAVCFPAPNRASAF